MGVNTKGEKRVMEDNYFYGYGGVLSDIDITNAMKAGDIFIAPYDVCQLQPSGYNLTPTRFFYSTKKKKLLPIIENEDETYVVIDKNDSVLVRTRESIAVSSRLSGAFYSKVKVVSQGFGHVSTTLDPNWEGQLLISLNNPTNKQLKFSIEKNVYGKKIYNSFVTVEFMYLNSPSMKKADNTPGRLDILDETIERNISIWKRRKLEELYQFVEQLHERESRSIEHILFQTINDEEREQWKQIQMLSDEKEYAARKSDFLAQKQKKYLRMIQEKFTTDAVESIGIVNEYINQKQKLLPLRYRAQCYLVKNIHIIIGLVIAVAEAIALIVFWLFSGKDASQSSNGGIYIIGSAFILYILGPIIKSVWEHIWIK